MFPKFPENDNCTSVAAYLILGCGFQYGKKTEQSNKKA